MLLIGGGGVVGQVIAIADADIDLGTSVASGMGDEYNTHIVVVAVIVDGHHVGLG